MSGYLFCMRSEWMSGKVYLHTKKPARLGEKETPEKNWSVSGDDCVGSCDVDSFELLTGRKIDPGKFLVRFPSGKWSGQKGGE